MNWSDYIRLITQDLKVATTVAAGTVTTSLGFMLDMIPNSIGKLGILVGTLLSTVLIYTNIRIGRATHAKLMLEIDAFKRKENYIDSLKLEIAALIRKEKDYQDDKS